MSAQNGHIPPSERVARLERKAKVIRSRLLRAVDALDARRHQVVEVGHQARAIAMPAAISLIGIAALFGVSVLAFGAALRSRRRLSISNRLSDGVSHALRRVELARQPSFGRRVFEKVALTVVTFAVGELAKRAAKNMADGRLPDGRLAVGNALGFHHQALALPRGAGR
ncbi:MAG TPA: hypothetical protein VM925_05020 [Labilithrix sp.]|nr:hypothetical protein [Labilithrix sp.]